MQYFSIKLNPVSQNLGRSISYRQSFVVGFFWCLVLVLICFVSFRRMTYSAIISSHTVCQVTSPALFLPISSHSKHPLETPTPRRGKQVHKKKNIYVCLYITTMGAFLPYKSLVCTAALEREFRGAKDPQAIKNVR